MTLVDHRGKVLPVQSFGIHLGIRFFGDTRTVDTHIQRLRKSLMQAT
ncbi:helix-turn-helix domain-containing protein [Bacillus licheniformis]|nr:helix-turn-helix domain-containing protein [Bacillus licheniformis]